MENAHQVHNFILLDESGSMGSIKQTIIAGFNEIVQTVKGIGNEFPEQKHFISLVSFNGLGTKVLHFMDPVEKLEQINDKNYRPNASTPLFDALGFGLNKLYEVVSDIKDCNVLVTILTDGAENASKEYEVKAIQNLIDELKSKKWTFTYIGADHDVESMAFSISINNTMVFKKNDADIKAMFSKEKAARAHYSANIRNKVDVSSSSFYNSNNVEKPDQWKNKLWKGVLIFGFQKQ